MDLANYLFVRGERKNFLVQGGNSLWHRWLQVSMEEHLKKAVKNIGKDLTPNSAPCRNNLMSADQQFSLLGGGMG